MIVKIEEMMHEGNVRHIQIQDEGAKVRLNIPLTVGVVGVVVAPVWAAIGALAALASNLRIIVERVPNEKA